MYGLEYLLVYELRNYLDGVIDLLFMGCRIGYYFFVWGEREVSEIKEVIEILLRIILDVKEMLVVNVI